MQAHVNRLNPPATSRPVHELLLGVGEIAFESENATRKLARAVDGLAVAF